MQFENHKKIDLAQAVDERAGLRHAGRNLVMTNGCFDLLHAGHVYFLQETAKLGRPLWILLNSDASVRALKGPYRPIESEEERAYRLAAFACVDRILLFHKPDLVDEIKALAPDIYAKAGDYTLESLHAGERAAFEAIGTEIHFLPFLAGFSSTRMIRRIHEAAANEEKNEHA
ncbi:MAG: adenylyltransferase/cytidyltransferase family protein [Opitutales bacterium]